MKRSFHFLVVCGIMVGALLTLGVGVAFAVPLTNTGISLLSFDSGACGPLAGDTTSPFSFNGGPDGTVRSAVFQGCAAGMSAGLWFYGYRIDHFATSSEEMIHRISMRWSGLTPYDFAGTDEGGETSFWIMGTGSRQPSDAAINPAFAQGTLTFGFDHEREMHILPGETSTWFGAVATLPPGTVFANLVNSGQESEAQVLVPVPEPASLLLLTSGLLGLSGLGAIRRRKVKIPATV